MGTSVCIRNRVSSHRSPGIKKERARMYAYNRHTRHCAALHSQNPSSFCSCHARREQIRRCPPAARAAAAKSCPRLAGRSLRCPFASLSCSHSRARAPAHYAATAALARLCRRPDGRGVQAARQDRVSLVCDRTRRVLSRVLRFWC